MQPHSSGSPVPYRLLSWRALPTAAWLCCIFCLSGQSAPSSAGLSMMLSRFIAGILLAPDLFAQAAAMLGLPATPDELARSIHFLIRKAAHMTEFMIFTWLAAWWLRAALDRRPACRWALILCLAAASDEAHQLFVPGRAGQLSDVAIDFTGGLIGMGAASFLQRMHSRMRTKHGSR